jgi:hypothetical protein
MNPPDVEFTAVLAVADVAMCAVLGDEQVWLAEAAKEAAAPLPWPLLARGEGYPQLLRILATEAVESTLQAIQQAEGQAIDVDPASEDFQLVLRVVNRAVQSADAAMCRAFGGPRGGHRLNGKGKFHNWLKLREVEAAVMSGARRGTALGKLPFSPASAYRAMHRKA